MLWFDPKSSRIRGFIGKLGLDFAACTGVNGSMDDTDEISPDLVDLVVQLCTRIGMIIEDVSAIAINASRDGLEDRVTEVVRPIRTMTPLADAVEVLRRP